MRRLFHLGLLLGTSACLLGVTATAQVAPYYQDFESVDRTQTTALSDDGWKLFAAGINGVPDFPNFAVGPFAAPNDINNPVNSIISDIASGGDPPAGNQGLVIFSDYGSSIHTEPLDPRDLVISVFQEQTITNGDIGKIVAFEFLSERNAFPPTGDAVTEAFLVTLDPNDSFNATNNLIIDTTNVPDGAPTFNRLVLDLSNPALEGQILQFGFRSISSDGEGTGVDYDNVRLAVPEPSTVSLIALAGIALVGLRSRRRSALM